MINDGLLNKLKLLLRLGDTINRVYAELETLLHQDVFSEPPAATSVLSCAEVFVGNRVLKEIEISSGRLVCKEMKGREYDTIVFSTIPRGYCITLGKHQHPCRSYCFSTLRELLSLACNLSEEDIDRIIEAAKNTLNIYSETIEELKQLLALVRMILR